jgi:DNA-binding MarR family transcriptional regulator
MPQATKPADTGLAAFEEAWDEFFGTIRRLRAQAAREVGTGELTEAQLHLLAALSAEAELPVGELAELAGVSPPTATRMIDGLVRDGVVERRPSTADRRVRTIRLTTDGRELLERKKRLIRAKRRRLYESLPAAERDQYPRLLKRLARGLEEL